MNDNVLKSYYDTSDCDPPLATTSRYDVRGDTGRKDDALSSSSDESSDEDAGEVDHKWAELDKDVPRSTDTSHRLAVCNVDWDRIKAQDLFVLFNSFKPGGASILSVKRYASEFGKKRMADEAVRGPTEIAETAVVDEDEHEAGDAVEDEFMQEKLRQYQLNRLKYYYAIVECDSSSTADTLYEQLDNFEFESSASSLDLRFVPDGEVFDDEPDQLCTSLPDTASYKPPIFITSALQQSSVRLTWDETDPSRAEKIESAFASRDEKQLDDLQAFLASENSESSDEETEVQPQSADEDVPMPTKLSKYKQLLQAVEEENKNEDPDMEITFDNDDDDEESDRDADSEPDGKDDDGDDASSDSNNESARSGGDSGSAFEEDAAVRGSGPGDGLNLLVEEEGKSHFNFNDFIRDGKKRAKGSPADAGQDFEFNEEDPRFSSVFSVPEYNIDPSNPHFRKTPAMMTLMQRKAELVTGVRQENKRKDSPVAGLVAAVKANTRKLAQKRQRHH